MHVDIRASSFSELFDCPARWYAKYIERIPYHTSGRAYLGTSLHTATAVFDQQIIDGNPISADDAAGVFVDTLKEPDRDVVWNDIGVKEAQNVGIPLVVDYCQDISPLYTFEAVELLCDSMEIDFENGVTLNITGHVDRIRKEGEKRGINDIKSGTRAVNADGDAVVDKHIVQLGTYELLEIMATETTKAPIELPAEIIALPTAGNRRVAIGKVERPSDLLIGKDGEKGLLEMAADIMDRDIFFGNPRSMLCSVKYCPAFNQCKWRGATK